MAHRAQAFEAFGAATNRPAASIEKIGASLRLTPFGLSGGQGGGANTVHVPASFLAGLILGSAAYQPRDGHQVVTEAAQCDYLGSAFYLEADGVGGIIRSEPQGVDVPELVRGSATLMTYIQDRIEFYAGEPADAIQTLNRRPLLIADSLIRLDFEPFAARVEWRAEGGLLLVHHFVPQKELAKRQHMDPKAAANEMARIRRSSILPASLIFLAAKLLADGRAKSGKQLPGSGQGGATSSASSKHEKTPGLPEPGASQTTNQSRDQRETGLSTRPDTKRVCVHYQARTGSRGRHMMERRREGTGPGDPFRLGLFPAGPP